MIDNLISGSPGKVDYSYDTCLLGLPPATSPTSRLSLVSQIAVIGVSAHPFLSSGVLHHPLVLSRSNWPYADLGVGVVGAKLFWLHFLATLKSAAESQVDVALVLRPTFLPKLAGSWCRRLALHPSIQALHTKEACLAVSVSVADLPLLLPKDRETAAGNRVLCVNANMSVATVLVACTLSLVARVVVLLLLSEQLLYWRLQNPATWLLHPLL